LGEALARLQEYSDRLMQVVDCRFFGGMSIDETARALGVSPATVKRDWSLAQARLYREMRETLK
jgi:DNA-directed RNA polymerase specialized sigma24 family protein